MVGELFHGVKCHNEGVFYLFGVIVVLYELNSLNGLTEGSDQRRVRE